MVDTVNISGIKQGNGWSPIRRELGVQAFGINAWTKDTGEQLVGEHDEKGSGHEELYVVIAGSAMFSIDGEDVEAPTGTVVFVKDPASRRAAVATADGTTLLSVGGKAGAAYAALPWEVNAHVFELFERGEIEESKAILTDALDRYEDRSVLLYNLACAEARLGALDKAFEHLAAAIEARPSLAKNAREDDDLDALKSDERFDALVGAAVAG